MSDNPPITAGEVTAELLAEARDWIVDIQNSYDYDDARDIVNHWTETRIVQTIERYYAGGWRAFVDATKWTGLPNVQERPEHAGLMVGALEPNDPDES